MERHPFLVWLVCCVQITPECVDVWEDEGLLLGATVGLNDGDADGLLEGEAEGEDEGLLPEGSSLITKMSPSPSAVRVVLPTVMVPPKEPVV